MDNISNMFTIWTPSLKFKKKERILYNQDDTTRILITRILGFLVQRIFKFFKTHKK